MTSKTLMMFILTAWIVAVPLAGRSQTVDDFLNSAQQEMDLWNFAEAIGFYDQALELDQSRPRVYFMRGTAKKETGDHKGALQDYDKALELDPAEPEYLYERGLLKYYIQDYAGAVADFDAFLELDPSVTAILKSRGEAKYQLNDFAGAVADYSLAIEQEPDNPELYYLRAFARADQEDWTGAVEDFTVVMEMEPQAGMNFDKRDTALLRRAAVKLRAGDFAGAHDDCTAAIERNDRDLEAYFIRGKARVALERFGDAVADFDVVIDQYPMADAFHERGVAKQRLGDADGAEADFAEAAERGYEEPE